MRAVVPVVGCSLPVMIWKSVDLPAPLRPMMPHRSPRAMVTETSVSSVVAPNDTPTSAREMSVIPEMFSGDR